MNARSDMAVIAYLSVNEYCVYRARVNGIAVRFAKVMRRNGWKLWPGGYIWSRLV